MNNEFERKLDLKLILSVFAAGLMSFTGVVVSTSMNVTFPTLMKQFDIGTATVQWITTGYLLILSVTIPLSSFLKKCFTFSVLYLILIQFICLGIGFIIPNYSQLVMGKNAFTAGCILLPGCVIGAALNPFTGKLLDRRGAALPILIGAGSALVSSTLFALFIAGASTAALAGIYIFFAVAQGFTVGNIMTNGLRSLPNQLNADGNAVFSTFQQLAGAMGTSVASTIVAAAQQQIPSNIAAGTRVGAQNAFILLLVLTVLMTVFAYKAVITQKS